MSATQIAFTKPKARTAHICSLCSRTIDPGETYYRHRMVGDDGPYVWKQCAHCSAIIRIYGNDFVYDWHEGYGPDDVQEWEPATDAGKKARTDWGTRWRDADGVLVPIPEQAAS